MTDRSEPSLEHLCPELLLKKLHDSKPGTRLDDDGGRSFRCLLCSQEVLHISELKGGMSLYGGVICQDCVKILIGRIARDLELRDKHYLKICDLWRLVDALDKSEGLNKLMTPSHPEWRGFCEMLEGPQCCNFHKDDDGEIRWTCGGGHDQSFARRILENISDINVDLSLKYFTDHGGHCDCEILMNIDAAYRRSGART